MALFVGSDEIIPQFISAPTPESLRKKIRDMQRVDRAQYRFINFCYIPEEKRHIAWFYKEISNEEITQELIDGTSKE